MTTSTDAVCIARKHTVAARGLPAARAAVISSLVIAAILVRQSCTAPTHVLERIQTERQITTAAVAGAEFAMAAAVISQYQSSCSHKQYARGGHKAGMQLAGVSALLGICPWMDAHA
jgi:hypothetical protein